MSVRDFIRYCNTVGLSTGIKTYPWTHELNQSFLDLVAYQQGKMIKNLIIAQGYREKIVMTTFFDTRRLYLRDTELIRPLDKPLRVASFSSSILYKDELLKTMDKVNVGEIYMNPSRASIVVEPYLKQLTMLSYSRK